MPATSYTVTNQGRQISGKPLQTGDSSLINTGSDTIYVSDSQVLTAETGQPIAPGSTLIWENTQEQLWAWCATTSTLMVSTNAGSGVDAGGIAQQLIAQGLANDIASAISLQGVPPIDRPTTLLQDTRAVASGTQVIFPIIDASSYASLMFGYGETGVSGAGTQVRFIQFAWYADAAGTLAIGADAVLPSVDGGQALGQIAVRGPYVQIIYNAVATAVSSTCTITVDGSFRSLAAKRVRCASSLANTVTVSRLGAADGLSIASGSVGAGVALDWYPWCWAGPITINVNIGAITVTPGAVDLLDMSSGKVVCRITLPVSASSQNYIADCWVPAGQYQVKITNNGGAAANYTITLQQQGAA